MSTGGSYWLGVTNIGTVNRNRGEAEAISRWALRTTTTGLGIERRMARRSGPAG